jgi:hypothetical protein
MSLSLESIAAFYVARTMNAEELSQGSSTIELHGPLLLSHDSALVR